MRRVLVVLGIVCTLIVVAFAVLFAVTAIRGSGLDAEAQAYVDQAVPDITRTWSEAALIKRASPAFLAHASHQQLATWLRQMSNTGSLVHYDGAHGQATLSFMLNSGSSVRGHYEAEASFENGKLHFRIDLSKLDGQWMIDGFHVDIGSLPNWPERRAL